MAEDTFLEQIQPIPDHDHMYYVLADWSLGTHASCRAYINFVNQEDVFIFKEKFDGYVFVDARGNEYPAVVEYAPFQKTIKYRSKKTDRKANTLDNSDHYLQFLKSLDVDENLPKLELKSDFDLKRETQIKSTPLLEYLNDGGKRYRGQRERNHDKQHHQEKKILAPIREEVSKSAGSRDQDKGGLTRKEQGKPERSEKEKARRAERDRVRREKRKKEFEDKKKERQLSKQGAPGDGQGAQRRESKKEVVRDERDGDNKGQGAEPKKPIREVKKYSERRQESRKKKEDVDKVEDKSSAQQRGTSSQGDARRDEKGGGSKDNFRRRGGGGDGEDGHRGERLTAEEKRRLRNKDRPSMQIYKPGSRGRGGKGEGSSISEDKSETVSNDVKKSNESAE